MNMHIQPCIELPAVSRLYFTGKVDCHLSSLQAAILLGLGLQHKTVDTLYVSVHWPPCVIPPPPPPPPPPTYISEPHMILLSFHPHAPYV